MPILRPLPDTPAALELDLRHLPPPEPMRRILDALAALPAGQVLVARTPCHPVPLLERLHADGYRVAVEVAPAGDATVRIMADDDRARA
ncbi:DUF2249 domain-containing protein [Vulcaniibacterium gelatinicum]|uniref:DUF2249 domain-containing protein n=1 Tax=Vulcaniibacterium gelatinicum TaxID=2598725 RepID=UPI0011CAD151|nr:DUF2249 domain-containing protein [Vulcaniibacterium gelatinicum]